MAQGLLGVAEVPADAGQKRVAILGAIERVAGRRGAAPFRIIKRDAPLQMYPGGDQFGGPEQLHAHLEMGVGKEFRVLTPFGQSEQLLRKRPSPAQIPRN